MPFSRLSWGKGVQEICSEVNSMEEVVGNPSAKRGSDTEETNTCVL